MNEIFLAEATYRLLKDKRSIVMDTLEFGEVKDMEQYRELMGWLRALEFIEQELKSLLEKQEHIDD
jgi:hypothetical protein|tara:strand:+ start:142 stop:339 length:198 start_codon:yes stop_codon:yes gene_type:complete